jgi:hypothetical protein
MESVIVTNADERASPSGGFFERIKFLHVRRRGFFDEDVLAILNGLQGGPGKRGVGRSNHYRVDVGICRGLLDGVGCDAPGTLRGKCLCAPDLQVARDLKGSRGQQI